MPLNDTTTLGKGQHLTLTERIEIQEFKRQKKSNRIIAKALNRSHSTIKDEFKRGWARQKKILVDRFIHYAKKQIKVHKWSPDVNVGSIIKDGLFYALEHVCAKTLDTYIDADLMELNNMDLWLKLQRNTKPNQVSKNKRNLGKSIEERSSEVNNRVTFGHWEIDTVVGKKTKDQPVC